MRTYEEAQPDVLRSTIEKNIVEIVEIDSKQRGRKTERQSRGVRRVPWEQKIAVS